MEDINEGNKKIEKSAEILKKKSEETSVEEPAKKVEEEKGVDPMEAAVA